jgi:hypothetical protein
MHNKNIINIYYSSRLLGVEEELGATLAELGSGDSVSGGPYMNVWSGIGSALENNQAAATILGKLAQQVELNATSVEKMNHANMESAHLKTQFVGLYQNQIAEEMKVTQLGGQLYQLTMLLKQMQQEQQQTQLSASTLPEPGQSDLEPVTATGIPVEDAVEQLQLLQLHMVQSRLRSDGASVAGHVFESYEDTYQWVVANCSSEDWQYVSLVRPEGQHHDVMLTEEYNSSKAGCASSSHACLSLSFKTKVSGFCGLTGQQKVGIPSQLLLSTVTVNPLELKNDSGIWGFGGGSVRALDASTSKRMSVHMTHKVAAHRIFLTLPTDSVQKMLKLHRTMDAQFQRYQQVLGLGESNWMLSIQFSEAMFAGTWRAILIGSDTFSATGHT